MKFCRQCGTPLSGGMPATPTPVPGQLSTPQPAPTPTPTPRQRQSSPTPPPTQGRAPSHPPKGGQITCVHCQASTPAGFAFCQQCGSRLPTGNPAEDLANAPTGVANGSPAAPAQAQESGPTGPVVRPSQTPTPKSMPVVQAEPPWAHLVSVNRDGSEGAAHPLVGDFVDIGSSRTVHLPFEDPYMAPTHARIERVGGGGARIVPVDRLNGVYKRLREDTAVPSGAIILLGREVLRLEVLREDERKAKPLVQHGVSLFASPAREPWGRISQLMPSGAILDVRHLFGEEMIIGREEGNVVFADDEFLSRRHAAFRWQNGRCILADLGSSNGTFVKLTEPSTLSQGDFLRMGDQMFRFKPGG